MKIEQRFKILDTDKHRKIRIKNFIAFIRVHPCKSVSYQIFCLCFVLISGCKEAERYTVAGIGDPAPEFTLTDLNGKKVSLKDYRGKKVVLNFWATWCPPCVKEMPLLQEISDTKKDKGVTVIGINYNENHERVRKFVSGHEIKFTILIDRDLKVSMDYGIIGLPVTFFIDENGRIKDKVKGGLSREIIEDKLASKSFIDK